MESLALPDHLCQPDSTKNIGGWMLIFCKIVHNHEIWSSLGYQIYTATRHTWSRNDNMGYTVYMYMYIVLEHNSS